MKQYKNPEPSLPLLITDQNVFSTPKSISHGLKAGEAWQKKLEKVLSSPSQRKFCSFVKGNEVLWHGLELIRGDLAQIQAYAKERRQMKDIGRRYIAGKGPIKVKDAWVAISEKEAKKEKAKDKAKGKAKGKAKDKVKGLLGFEVSSDIEPDIEAQGEAVDETTAGANPDDDEFFRQNPELKGFAFGDPLPRNPFEAQDDYVTFY